MSYESAKRIPLSDKQGVFSGGYVDNVENLNLAPFFSPYLRNCRIDGQSTTIRPGHQLYVNLGGDVARGIGSYLATTGDNLIVRHNESATEKLVLINTSGAETNITTGANIASDNRMTFTNIGDVVYCMNGSDKFGKLSGTTYTTPASVSSNFAPAFSVVFNGSHFASGWSTNSNTVYKSVADVYDDFTSTGSDQLTFIEQITGLSSNSQALFYFTENTISVTGQNDIQDNGGTLSYITRALQVKEGAINHYSIIEVGTSIFYVTPSNAINRIVPGGNVYGFEVQDLSERKREGISKIMASLDKDQSGCWGYFLPKEMLIKRWFKTQGAVFNDICIVYDVIQDKFLIDGEKYFYDGVFFNGSNYTIGAIDGKVYQDEYSQDDEGSPIAWEYWTKEFYLSKPTFKMTLWESRTLLDINELANPTQTIFIDGVEVDSKTLIGMDIVQVSGGIAGGEIASFAIGDDGDDEDMMGDDDYFETYIMRTKGNLNKKGKKVQRRYTNTTLAGKVRLKSLEPLVEQLPAISTSLTR